jgi:aconitase B
MPARSRNTAPKVLATFELKTDVLMDEVRAGGRINLIIGRGLTDKAREVLGLPFSTVFSVARSRWPIPARASPWPRRWWARPAA